MDPESPSSPSDRSKNAAVARDKTDLEYFMRVRGPELLKQQAGNIILAVLIVAAVAMFFYNRARNKAVERSMADQTTAIAYSNARQARAAIESPLMSSEAGHERQERVRTALTNADAVLASDAGEAQKATAQLSKAEVFWALANAPAAALATTQPVSGFTTREPSAYLADAEAAYTEILSKYTSQTELVGNALLGMAAISENRKDFDGAAKWYNRAIDDKALRAEYKAIAKTRLGELEQLRKPFALATPTSQPTTTTAEVMSPLDFTAPPPATTLPAEPQPTTAP